MAGKKANTTMWKAAKAIGVILAILGVIMVAYSAYVWSSFGSRVGSAYVRRMPGGYLNASGYNQSGFNQSRLTGSSRLGLFRISPYAEGIVIGILMILLGIVTYKYASIKAVVVTKK